MGGRMSGRVKTMRRIAQGTNITVTVYTTLTEAAVAHVTSHVDLEGEPTDDVLATMQIVMITPVSAEATAAAKPRAAAALRKRQVPWQKPSSPTTAQATGVHVTTSTVDVVRGATGVVAAQVPTVSRGGGDEARRK